MLGARLSSPSYPAIKAYKACLPDTHGRRSISRCCRDLSTRHMSMSRPAKSSHRGNLAHVAAILHKIEVIAKSSPDVTQDQLARAALLQVSRELTASLEQPDELVSNLAFSGGRYMCVRVGDELNLFESLAKNDQTAADLASSSGAEEQLLVRILRTLAAMGFVGQKGGTFFATPATHQMTKQSVRAGVKHFFEEGLPVNHATPAYLKANGYRTPQSMTDGPFQYANRTSLQTYEYWTTTGADKQFNTFMQGLFGTPARIHWLGWFPANKVVVDGFDKRKSEYLLVDVGGGRGHEAEAFINKHPNTLGTVVLEDLPFVINDIRGLDPRIQKLAHDFTKPQPIRNARAYFMQNILHNWPDPVCDIILSQLRTAMAPGYSKLLIGNVIIPEEGAPLRQCGLDIAMLTLHSGAQRNETEWKSLLERNGLNVIKFWHPPGDGDGIIEAEVKM